MKKLLILASAAPLLFASHVFAQQAGTTPALGASPNSSSPGEFPASKNEGNAMDSTSGTTAQSTTKHHKMSSANTTGSTGLKTGTLTTGTSGSTPSPNGSVSTGTSGL